MTRRGVLLIGGSSDIGLAIARAFVDGGDAVVGVGLEDSADPVFERYLVADCSAPEAADRAVADAELALGRLDVVVLAAGRMPIGRAEATSDEDWRGALGATLDSAFFVARAALPRLTRGSSIVAVTSVNSSLAAPALPRLRGRQGGRGRPRAAAGARLRPPGHPGQRRAAGQHLSRRHR